MSTQRFRSRENEDGAGNLTSDFRSIVSVVLSAFFGWTSPERGEVEDAKHVMLVNWELKRMFVPKWE